MIHYDNQFWRCLEKKKKIKTSTRVFRVPSQVWLYTIYVGIYRVSFISFFLSRKDMKKMVERYAVIFRWFRCKIKLEVSRDFAHQTITYTFHAILDLNRWKLWITREIERERERPKSAGLHGWNGALWRKFKPLSIWQWVLVCRKKVAWDFLSNPEMHSPHRENYPKLTRFRGWGGQTCHQSCQIIRWWRHDDRQVFWRGFLHFHFRITSKQ